MGRPKQAGCCCNNPCCKYKNWEFLGGYYYADSPPPNADPSKALSRSEWILDECSASGYDLTFTTKFGFTCDGGIYNSDNSNLRRIRFWARKSIKVTETCSVDCNVVVSNVFRASYGSTVAVSINPCKTTDPAGIGFKFDFIPPLDYTNTYGYEDFDSCEVFNSYTLDKTPADPLNLQPGYYTISCTTYYAYLFGWNKDATIDVSLTGLSGVGECS